MIKLHIQLILNERDQILDQFSTGSPSLHTHAVETTLNSNAQLQTDTYPSTARARIYRGAWKPGAPTLVPVIGSVPIESLTVPSVHSTDDRSHRCNINKRKMTSTAEHSGVKLKNSSAALNTSNSGLKCNEPRMQMNTQTNLM